MSMIIPESFWLNINDYCNNKCVWCYEQDNNEAKKIMDIDLASSIISTMSQAGSKDCIIIGGEPTLHPSLLEIVQVIKEKGLRALLVTNGRLLNNMKVVEELCARSIDAINLSIHGWDAESYKKYTGTNGFTETVKAIDNLTKKGVNLGTAFVLSKYVENDLEIAIKAIAEIGVEFIEFNMGAPAISENGISGDYVIPISKQKDIVMNALRTSLKLGLKPGFNFTIPHCIFSAEELKELFGNARIASGCSMRNGSGIVFKVDGSITLCNHFLDFNTIESDTSFIHHSKEELLSFWNSEELGNIRSEVNCYNHEACSECAHWSMCGGGCPINWMFFNPQKENLKPFINKVLQSI